MGMGAIPLLLRDPNSSWSIAASLFPLTSPYVMVPRVGLEMPPLWQIGASIGLLLLSIWASLWFSSRLYRIGILMYGKRPTLPELMNWLRIRPPTPGEENVGWSYFFRGDTMAGGGQ